MLAKLCDASEVGVVESTMKHPLAGWSCFTKVSLKCRTVVWYHNAKPVYPNLCEKQHNDILDVEGAMSMSVKDLQTGSGHIPEGATEFEVCFQNAWIVFDAFNPVRYMNYLRILNGVANLRLVRGAKCWNYQQFGCTQFYLCNLFWFSGLKQGNTTAVKTLRIYSR